MDCSTPGFPVHHYFPEPAQTHVHWVSDAVQPSHLLSSPSSPAFKRSQHQSVFQWVSSLHQVAKVLELQFQHQSFQRTFWTWLVWSPCCPRDSQVSAPAPQFKCISSWLPAFFIVQLSHPYMTIGKITALTIQTFVDKVMSLLFNILSRLVIAFLPRIKHILISWLQSPSAVSLELKKIKLPKIITAYFPMGSDHKV